jgi:pimeloyl-ACP methyl ester carboxylesterase
VCRRAAPTDGRRCAPNLEGYRRRPSRRTRANARKGHAPSLITFGARDLICGPRFAEPLKNGIAGSKLEVFEHLSHAGLHEDPETFNRATLDFLLSQRS